MKAITGSQLPKRQKKKIIERPITKQTVIIDNQNNENTILYDESKIIENNDDHHRTFTRFTTIVDDVKKQFNIGLPHIETLFQKFSEAYDNNTGALASTQQRYTLNELRSIEAQLVAELKSFDKAFLYISQENKRFQKKDDDINALFNRMYISHEDKLATLQHTYLENEKTLKQLKHEADEATSLLEELKKEERARKEEALKAKELHENLKYDSEIKNWEATATLQLVSQINGAGKELIAYQQRLTSLRSLMESQRRGAHERLQEIKGNLRVFCRIRPLISVEINQKLEKAQFSILNDDTALIVTGHQQKNWRSNTSSNATHSSNPTNLGVSGGTVDTLFGFDRVFDWNSTQEDIFQETSNLIQSALDGFNVSLFAYGQTGSGKTFTMEGIWEKDSKYNILRSEAGIIPRAIHLIFNTIQDLTNKGWRYRVEISILEIYNETIRDLLQLGGSPNIIQEYSTMSKNITSGNISSRSTASSCDIKLDAYGNTIVSNLTSIPVNNSKEVYELLSLAQRHRAVASTACNEQSSRSHSVFQLKIIGDRVLDGKHVQSTLSLVDLAGSERLEKSLAAGDRLKEAQHINKSLSCLCDVIYAIAGRKTHIPFRNSKLTMLLKDSLGGRAKTLMFVNISPLKYNLSESLNSLRFAAKANSCAL